MIIGVDVGNYYTKSSEGISFVSKVGNTNSILGSYPVSIGNKIMYLEEGEIDTEYRKAYKESYLYLLLGAIRKSSIDNENKVVVGLPLSQYRTDRAYLMNRILQSGIVTDIEVEPEGVAAVPDDYTGIILDIGGGTTDICLLQYQGKKRKILHPYSLPKGILNLESELINQINSHYGLDLLPIDADRIIRDGLFIYGERQKFSMDIYKDFVESIVRRVQVDYSLKTNNLVLVGGGAQKLFMAFKRRIPQSRLINNSFYANADAFKRKGELIWE